MKLIDIDKVIAEIKKLKGKVYDGSSYCNGWQHALRMLEIELATLETKEVDLEKDKPVTNDLERAALLHYPKMSRISEPHGIIPADNKSHYLGDANENNRKAFIVGAQWQKEQDAPETKEVNLKEELERLDRILYDLDGVAIAGATCYLTVEDVKDIAKHFYEFGLKVQKGE